jgi:putative phage-type endonuclease
VTELRIVTGLKSGTPEWLAERQKGIGGSDAGTIAGVNSQYGSQRVLWSHKTGETKNEFTGNEATEWGNLLEDDVAAKYAKDYNKALVEWPVLIWSSDVEHSFMFANLDYVEVTPSKEFPAGQITVWNKETPPPGIIDIVECKTTGIATMGTAKKWANRSVPETYMVQGYHYGIVLLPLLPVPHVTFVALVGGQGLQVRKMGSLPDDDIVWDDQVAENILAAESDFWDLVTYQIEPEIDGSDVTEELIASKYPRSEPGIAYSADQEFFNLVNEFKLAKEATKQAGVIEKELRSKIVAKIQSSESAKFNDQLLLTYKSGEDRKTFDSKRFQEDNPLLYKQYEKTGPGSRTLLIKIGD